MARTYTGNQAAANAQRKRNAQERKAETLRALGWICTPPEEAAALVLYNHLVVDHGQSIVDVESAVSITGHHEDLHARQTLSHNHGYPDPHINPGLPMDKLRPIFEEMDTRAIRSHLRDTHGRPEAVDMPASAALGLHKFLHDRHVFDHEHLTPKAK